LLGVKNSCLYDENLDLIRSVVSWYNPIAA